MVLNPLHCLRCQVLKKSEFFIQTSQSLPGPSPPQPGSRTTGSAPGRCRNHNLSAAAQRSNHVVHSVLTRHNCPTKTTKCLRSSKIVSFLSPSVSIVSIQKYYGNLVGFQCQVAATISRNERLEKTLETTEIKCIDLAILCGIYWFGNLDHCSVWHVMQENTRLNSLCRPWRP